MYQKNLQKAYTKDIWISDFLRRYIWFQTVPYLNFEREN